MPWVLPFLAVACVRTGPDAPGAAIADAGDAGGAGRRIPIPGLRDVACAEGGCVALAATGLVRLDDLSRVSADLSAWDTLRPGEGGGWGVEGDCEGGRCAAPLGGDGVVGPSTPIASVAPALEDQSPPLAEDAKRYTAWWNAAIANRWRAGFRRVVVGPGDAVVSWSRGGEGVGQLVRSGARPSFARVPAPDAPVSYPAWLALHPTGTEGYLLPWPATTVTAFDPVALTTRWTAALGGAGVGLFVDAGGRWLLAEVGDGDVGDRWLDWPVPALPDAPAADPFRDEVLRASPRPPATHTVVVDLSAHSVVARVPGRHRRFLGRPDGGWLLATDREVLLFPP